MAFPLYFGLHVRWTSRNRPAQVADLHQVRALPVAFALGAVAPMVMMMAPTWLGPGGRSPAWQQTIIALFQPSPILFSFILALLSRASARLDPSSPNGTGASRSARRWVRGFYLLAAALAGIGRIYVFTRIITAADNSVNFVRMYVPLPSTGPVSAPEPLIGGPWLFLQWDSIIITLASLLWAFQMLRQGAVGDVSASVVLLILAIGTVVIGPGATVTVALYIREGHLSERKGSI